MTSRGHRGRGGLSPRGSGRGGRGSATSTGDTGRHEIASRDSQGTTIAAANHQSMLLTDDQDTPARLSVYTGHLPVVARDSSLRFKAGNSAALDLGVVLLTSMFDLLAPNAPPPTEDKTTKVADMKRGEKCLQKNRTFIVIHEAQGHLYCSTNIHILR